MAIAHSLAALPLASASGGGADDRVSECPQSGATVSDDGEIDDEVRQLIAVLGG